MATIEAILKISDESFNGTVYDVYSNADSSNISNKILYNLIHFPSEESKAFPGAIVTMFSSASTIGDLRFGALLSTNEREATYNGVLLGDSGANGNNILTLTLTGIDIIGIEITFDKLQGLYPTSYNYVSSLDSNTHYVTNNTSNVIKIENLPGGSGTLTINFTNWNLANTPIGITYIDFPTETIPLTKAQIISFTSQCQVVTSTKGLSYAVVPTTGKIEINDTNNELYEKAKLGQLNAFLFTLELLVNGKAIQKHISTNSPIYTSDRKIELDLTDELALWDSIKVPGNTHTYTTSDTLYNVVYDLATYDGNIDLLEMCRDYTIVGTNQTQPIYVYLQGFKFKSNVTLQEGTLREQFEKVCNCSMLNIYVDRQNNIKFTSARPSFTLPMLDNGAIMIPYKKQYSKVDYDLLVSNRYEEVDFT